MDNIPPENIMLVMHFFSVFFNPNPNPNLNPIPNLTLTLTLTQITYEIIIKIK